MHFLATAADIASALPIGTVPTPNNSTGVTGGTGFTGNLVTNVRNLVMGAIVVLLLCVTVGALIFGALKQNMRKTLAMVIASLIALIPAGIVLGVGFVAVATGAVSFAGF